MLMCNEWQSGEVIAKIFQTVVWSSLDFSQVCCDCSTVSSGFPHRSKQGVRFSFFGVFFPFQAHPDASGYSVVNRGIAASAKRRLSSFVHQSTRGLAIVPSEFV